jgi:hypothetical protein
MLVPEGTVVNWRDPEVPGEIASSLANGEAKLKPGIVDVLTVKPMLPAAVTAPAVPVNGIV